MSLELNSKGLCQSSGKEKEHFCSVFPSSTKHEIRHFHVVVVQIVVQRRQRNEQKKRDSQVRFYFANVTLLVFCRSPASYPGLFALS